MATQRQKRQRNYVAKYAHTQNKSVIIDSDKKKQKHKKRKHKKLYLIEEQN